MRRYLRGWGMIFMCEPWKRSGPSSSETAATMSARMASVQEVSSVSLFDLLRDRGWHVVCLGHRAGAEAPGLSQESVGRAGVMRARPLRRGGRRERGEKPLGAFFTPRPPCPPRLNVWSYPPYPRHPRKPVSGSRGDLQVALTGGENTFGGNQGRIRFGPDLSFACEPNETTNRHPYRKRVQ